MSKMFATLDVKAFENWFTEWYKTAKQFKMSNKDIACAAYLSGWNAKQAEDATLRAQNAELIAALESFVSTDDAGIVSLNAHTALINNARAILAKYGDDNA